MPRKQGKVGTAVVEMMFMFPWLFFLFIGSVDMGIYTYSLVAVENAARMGAEHTSKDSSSASDQSGACSIAKNELAALPNMSNPPASCDSYPLIVTASSITGPDSGSATSVSVTYQGVQLIPIPGLLIGRLTITRNVQMRVRP